MEIVQLISEYGVVGLIFYLAIKEGFAYLGKRDKVEHGIYGNKAESEIGVLKSEMVGVKNTIDKIENNHLVHIQASLDKNTEEHTEIKVALGKILQKLEIK